MVEDELAPLAHCQSPRLPGALGVVAGGLVAAQLLVGVRGAGEPLVGVVALGVQRVGEVVEQLNDGAIDRVVVFVLARAPVTAGR
ncbi:hypothetical protein GCM10022248_44290 [Nonomuraea soli]